MLNEGLGDGLNTRGKVFLEKDHEATNRMTEVRKYTVIDNMLGFG